MLNQKGTELTYATSIDLAPFSRSWLGQGLKLCAVAPHVSLLAAERTIGEARENRAGDCRDPEQLKLRQLAIRPTIGFSSGVYYYFCSLIFRVYSLDAWRTVGVLFQRFSNISSAP